MSASYDIDGATFPAALENYRAAGWTRTFPLPAGQKDPPPTGITGKDGTAPDPVTLAEFHRAPSDSNLGVAVPQDLLGIDVDQYDAKRGHDNLAREVDRLGAVLPVTTRSTSRGPDNPSGIRFYRVPPGLFWRTAPLPGVELIAWHHRYAVVWPSVHPEGRPYLWYDEDGPLNRPPLVAGDWPDLPWQLVAGWTRVEEEPADHRPADPQRAAQALWHPKVTAKLAEYENRNGGSRHEAARDISAALARFEQFGLTGATSALDQLGDRFIADVTPDRGPYVAAAEWARMLSGGRVRVQNTASTSTNQPDDQSWIGDVEPDRLDERHADDQDNIQAFKFPDGHRPTDIGNAGRLLRHADGRLRYVHAWGKWIVYQNGRWIIDENDALVTEQAKHVPRALFRLAARVASKDPEEAKPIWTWALKSETSGSVAAMVRLARGAPGILVEHEQLDADPWLLNVRNGTIDLRTATLRTHDPADLMTLQCPVAYDPDAAAPLWETCVERWQPDPEVRRYVQVRAGAGATGKPTETVDVDYGSGGNGKSKFWGGVQHVLGDYTVVPHKSLLVAQRHEQHATVVARLFRKRLAVASETKSADVLDDEQVKNLTGGDRLSGRRMREDPWEFQPSHTLVMFSNHKPAVQGRDEGIWRRLRLVPWEVTIPEDERDENLAAKLEAEAPGILAWVVAGARQFATEGLAPPAAVRVATEAYRAAEDTVGQFITDVLRIGDGWAYSTDIKAELDAWCDERGVATPPRMNEIVDALKAYGCRDGGRRQVSGKRSTIWHGVAIAEVRAEAL